VDLKRLLGEAHAHLRKAIVQTQDPEGDLPHAAALRAAASEAKVLRRAAEDQVGQKRGRGFDVFFIFFFVSFDFFLPSSL
jgi:hypothetical protein